MTLVSIPPGTHVVRLEVRDRQGEAGADTASIAVQGRGEPVLIVSPDTIWPPGHRMIRVTAQARGLCGEPLILRSVTSSEPDDAPGGAAGHTVGDIRGAAIGKADADFDVRAERWRDGEGRTYTVTCEVSRRTGDPESLTARIHVPLDAGDLLRRSGRIDQSPPD